MVVRITRATDFQDIMLPVNDDRLDLNLVHARRDTEGGLTVNIPSGTPSPDTRIEMRENRYRGSTPNRGLHITRTAGYTNVAFSRNPTTAGIIQREDFPDFAFDQMYVYMMFRFENPTSGRRWALRRFDLDGNIAGSPLILPDNTGSFIGVGGEYAYFRGEGNQDDFRVDINGFDDDTEFRNDRPTPSSYTHLSTYNSDIKYFDGKIYSFFYRRFGSFRRLEEYDDLGSNGFLFLPPISGFFPTFIGLDDDFLYFDGSVFSRDVDGGFTRVSTNIPNEIDLANEGWAAPIGDRMYYIEQDTSGSVVRYIIKYFTLTRTTTGRTRQVSTIPFTTGRRRANQNTTFYVFRETKRNASGFNNDGYTMSISDGRPASFRDTWNLLGGKRINITDRIEIKDDVSADAVIREQKLEIADQVKLADNAAASKDGVLSAVDSVSIADPATATFERQSNATDRIVIGDSVGVAKQGQRIAVDAVAISDTPQLLKAGILNAVDSVNTTDRVTRARQLVVSASDNVRFRDTVSRVGQYISIIRDSVRLRDTVSTNRIRSIVLRITESFAIRDTASARRFDKTLSAAESVKFNDNISLSSARTRVAADSVRFRETIDRIRTKPAAATDRIRVRDSAAFERVLDAADNVSIDDSAATAVERRQEVADSISISDIAIFTRFRNTFIDIADSLRIRDTAIRTTDRAAADSVSIGDNAVTLHDKARVAADSVKFGETVDRRRHIDRRASDVVKVEDRVSSIRERLRTAADSVRIRDLALKDIGVDISETFKIDEIVDLITDRRRVISEVVRFRDAARKIHRRLARRVDISGQRMAYHLLKLRGAEDGEHYT